VHRPRAFRELEFHWSLLYGLTAGIIAYMAGRSADVDGLRASGIAVVASAGLLLGLQGAAVLAHGLRRTRIGPITRAALWITIFLLLAFTAVPLVALGAVDTVRDLRGLHRQRGSSTPS
jgi:hypothetical protein